jgi:hypothetical protein
MAASTDFPGTKYILYEDDKHLATAVLRSSGKVLQILPDRLECDCLDGWKEEWPTQNRLEKQTYKQYTEQKKAKDAEKEKERLARMSPDVVRIRALYDYYGIPNYDRSVRPRIYVEFETAILPVQYTRRRNDFLIPQNSVHTPTLKTSFEQVGMGLVKRFWYKPNPGMMLPAEVFLTPYPCQKIVYVSFYASQFNRDLIYKNCVDILKEKGYFVYLREKNADWYRTKYNLKKENPDVKEVLTAHFNGMYYRLSDLEKVGTKDIKNWF